MPNPLAQIPLDERLEIMRERIERDRKIFDENYLTLKDWFAEYNALYVLSFYLFYYLATPEGIDREAAGEPLDFYHYYLEIFQALALMHPLAANTKPLRDDAVKLQESVREIMSSYVGKTLGNLAPNISSADYARQMTIAEIRSETAAVRNHSYSSQVLAVAEDLLGRTADLTEPFYRLDLFRLMKALIEKGHTITEELNDQWRRIIDFHREKNIDGVLKSFLKNFEGADDEQEMRDLFLRMGSDLDDFKACLTAYTDLGLQYLFTTSADELAVYYGDQTKAPEIARVLDTLSYSFGDLSKANSEHFILDNPVLKKPFIKTAGNFYFSSLYGIIFHLFPNMIEVLVKEIGSSAVEKFQKAKAKFLEEETRRLFEKYFPHAQVFAGSKWTDPATGTIYENDLLVIIDRYVFVVECKSGAIDPSARRGGEARIITTLRDLVVKAARQAKGFIKYLEDNPGAHAFSTADGRTNQFDNSEVGHYVPLSITLESLGTVSSNLKRCLEAGLIEGDIESVIPTMTVTDLETVFEILDNEIERIHYLVRRSEIERNLQYVGDEGDLLGFYLDTGFNLGEAEEPGQYAINIVMKSKDIDPYFTARENGVTIPKPRFAQTKWWRDIIKHLIATKPSYWSEIGYVLLNVAYNEQKEFERKFKNYQARTKAGLLELQYNWVILETKPESRSYHIAGFPYLMRNVERRNQFITNQIISPNSVGAHQLGAICIGQDVTRQDYPYSVLAYVPPPHTTIDDQNEQ